MVRWVLKDSNPWKSPLSKRGERTYKGVPALDCRTFQPLMLSCSVQLEQRIDVKRGRRARGLRVSPPSHSIQTLAHCTQTTSLVLLCTAPVDCPVVVSIVRVGRAWAT